MVFKNYSKFQHKTSEKLMHSSPKTLKL